MRIIIFSDTHLHKHLEKSKFNFLKKIISNADKVIIAGDFWESTMMTFDEFISSPWKDLFPLLKEKKTVYIYGNHDTKAKSDKRTSLFSETQTERYTFMIGKKTFIVEHGDKLSTKIAQTKVTQPIRSLFYTRFFIFLIHTKTEKLLTVLFGRQILQLLFKFYNHKIKKTISKKYDKNCILICGHTHAAEIDLKNNFLNTGIIRHGIGQYIEIQDEKIVLKQEEYR